MWIWIVMFVCLFAAFGGGFVYLGFRAAEFPWVARLARGSRARARCVGFALFAVLTAVLWRAWNMMNALVCMVHLLLFWLLCDGAALLLGRLRGKRVSRAMAGYTALLLCTLWLAGGWYAAHHVRTTVYELETPKLDRDLRIVQITDSHLGATFDAARFADYVEEINALDPDVVVVTGDFVDDDTTRDDLLGGCAALGNLRTEYGVCYVYGNHDKGYFNEDARGWTSADLRAALVENGVTVLEDETVQLDGFCIVGRKDASEVMRGGGRLSAAEAMGSAAGYAVLLDHQPSDFDAEAEAGADLVLCGHTHGGQFLPIIHAGEWIGANCRTYGHERRLDTDFIVSSGISDWTLRFKTGCVSEIVVVDVHGTGIAN